MIGILIPVHNEETLLPDCLKAAMIAAFSSAYYRYCCAGT